MGFLSTILILVLCFLFYSSNSLEATTKASFHEPQCHPNELSALFNLKSSFSTYPSSNVFYHHVSTWNESINCCIWGGITCDEVSGHVIGLNLSANAVRGFIGSNSTLFFLRHLEILDLSWNDFRGSPISPEFGYFPNMTHLDLSYSSFRGIVPIQLSYLTKLVSLSLFQRVSDNTTIDKTTFKAIAHNLTNLRELSMYTIDMSSVPSFFLNNLSSLSSLVLGSCNLHGELPERIFRLPNLQKLFLSENNELTGSFPQSNWSTPLQTIGLSQTQISIDLPHLMKSARSLTVLLLSNCHFVGSYPLLRANLSQISFMFLPFNNFTGQIPWSSFGADTLSLLDLQSNYFTGQLAETYNNFTHNISSYRFPKLTTLRLSDNLLDGPIPSWVYALPSLNEFEINNNSLNGSVELDKLSTGKNLYDLDLSSNKFSLHFNDSINQNFQSLVTLGLSSCNITEYPKFIRFSKFLIILDLSHNFIKSVDPLFPWKNLQFLDLRFNLISGHLPILSSSLLSYLLLSRNQFTGPIPSSICNLTSLQLVDFSYNILNGEIPPCLISLSEKLTVLDLQRNGLQGGIPGTFPTKNSLQRLNLNGNMLEGPLPKSLALCTNLELLDLGNNLLSGTFPDWLESLTKLQVLVLRSNMFQGPIPSPKSIFSFNQLRIIDLSANTFSGALPTKLFENFKALMKADKVRMEYMGETSSYQDSILVTIKGVSVEVGKIQNILSIIDFSSNNFSGDIPDIIGSLKSLIGLNFSHNMISGTIPPSLGNLSNLEWLDFSNNQLFGEIPVQLVDIKWLQIFRLSNNELDGPIPRGKQFDTFDNDSYSGNPGLCGFPLSKSCSSNEAEQDHGDDGEHENKIVLDWKIVMMGFASGMVIGLSVGYMVLFSPAFDYWLKNRFGREPRHRTIAPLRT